MPTVEEILARGLSARDGLVSLATSEDIAQAEAELGFSFPQSYRNFVDLGGLSELRINHSVLSPAEIVRAVELQLLRDFVPFADNGCGDLYGWPRANEAEPQVLIYHHETNSTEACFQCFVAWLSANRF